MDKITEFDLASFLARNPRKRKHRSGKVKKGDEPSDIASWFMDNFTPGRLFEVLVDEKRQTIDIQWYVKRLLEIFRSEDSTNQVRIVILDRLRELILLGAIQDPDLLASISGKLSKPTADPFVKGEKLKVVGA